MVSDSCICVLSTAFHLSVEPVHSFNSPLCHRQQHTFEQPSDTILEDTHSYQTTPAQYIAKITSGNHGHRETRIGL
jgi:hypothetical protein